MLGKLKTLKDFDSQNSFDLFRVQFTVLSWVALKPLVNCSFNELFIIPSILIRKWERDLITEVGRLCVIQLDQYYMSYTCSKGPVLTSQAKLLLKHGKCLTLYISKISLFRSISRRTRSFKRWYSNTWRSILCWNQFMRVMSRNQKLGTKLLWRGCKSLRPKLNE